MRGEMRVLSVAVVVYDSVLTVSQDLINKSVSFSGRSLCPSLIVIQLDTACIQSLALFIPW